MGHGEEMEGCGKCMKYSLFLANFLILVGGIVVLAVGIWTLVDKSFLEELIGDNMYMSAAYILIGSGVVVILISFLGCLGAVKEIKCMLLTFFIIIFLIFATMLVGGILGYVFRDNVRDNMLMQMKSTVKKYTKYGAEDPITEAWDAVQSNLKCCGIEGEDSWKIWMNTENFNNEKQVPKSCCKKENGNLMDCQRNPTADNAYMKGCLDVSLVFVKKHAAIVGGVAIGVACLMILGMIFSFALFKMIE